MNTVQSFVPRRQSVAADEPRFRALLDPADWATLPAPVRRRFSVKLEHAQTLVYVGEVAETRMTLAGRCFGLLG